MSKTLSDDGVNVAQGAPAAPDPAPAPSPPPSGQEPSAATVATQSASEPPVDPGVARLRALVADRNVGDTLALVDRGWPAEDVLAAEQATKQRSTVIDALTPDDEQEQ